MNALQKKRRKSLVSVSKNVNVPPPCERSGEDPSIKGANRGRTESDGLATGKGGEHFRQAPKYYKGYIQLGVLGEQCGILKYPGHVRHM